MLSAATSRYIVGLIGNVISFGLFISPLPTFWRIIKKKDVEEFQPYPYVFTVINCLFWCIYGLPFIKPDNILVLTINGFGLVVEYVYLGIFIIYAKDKKAKLLVAALILLELLLAGGVLAGVILRFHAYKPRNLIVGFFCLVFNIIMYISPLAILRKVYKTKSVEYMPFFLSLANFLNGGCWTAYALFKIDRYMLTSNGLGCLSGAAQLIFYAYYGWYYKSKHGKGGDVKPSEIQLPASTAASRV